MLYQFIGQNAGAIVDRIRGQAGTETAPAAIEAAVGSVVSGFLPQLADRLRDGASTAGVIAAGTTQQGAQLLAIGLSVSQVIHCYGGLFQVITQFASEVGFPIGIEELRALSLCLDEAIASSVSEYERQRDGRVAHQNAERLGVLAHELRNRLAAATLAYSLIREGKAPIAGSTGAALNRSLRALRDMINNSLLEVRVEVGVGTRGRVSVSDMVQDVAEDAMGGATLSGSELVVTPIDPQLEVEADPQVLTAALGNLVQNAFKFNRPKGRVWLRASGAGSLVSIEVEDQCGGLPTGRAEDLFLPFQQRGVQRSGLGLGLSISRRGVVAMGGTLQARDLPGRGCIFVIELPSRAAGPAQRPGERARIS